jgi:hypothetical protein
MKLESAVGVSFFNAEAQRSQRNAEPCMWEDRKFGKTMELLDSPNGCNEITVEKCPAISQNTNSSQRSLCDLCASALKIFV